MQAWMQTRSLASVDEAYRQGTLTEDEVREYIQAWNLTPGRYTQAYLQDGAIRQRMIE